MSGLEDLYREIILDHYKNPRNKGELPSPPAKRAEGFNPLCGDQVIVTIDSDGKTVSDIKITGQGCSISQSSASIMSASVKGKDVTEVIRLIDSFKAMMSVHEQRLDVDGTEVKAASENPELGEIEALQGVVKFPVRIKCATLSWNTLQQALDESTEAQ